MFVVREREDLDLPIGPLKSSSGLEMVPTRLSYCAIETNW